MRIPFPTSRAGFRANFRPYDMGWAVASPVLALYLSNAYALTAKDGGESAGLYCFVSILCSVVAFLIFRIQDGVPRYFSVVDALDVSKAVVAAELLSCATLFSLTRLEGIPRSAPIIHALILLAGLVAARTLIRLRARTGEKESSKGTFAAEHIVIISSNSLSSLYIKLLHSRTSFQQRVVAVLDGTPGMIGRTIEGVRIVGAPEQLNSIIEEYSVHGVKVDRVIFGGDADAFSEELISEICCICDRRQIGLEFLPRIFGVSDSQAGIPPARSDVDDIELPAYFRWKRAIDFCAALLLITLLLPLFIGVGVVTLLDVGSPAVFWQQRMGARGRWFLLYKFRTLRAPFDWRGNPIPANQRLSRIGQLLRDTSLDELPQLLNVLVGDMSLIGPRPLLPEDQPKNSALRLMVAPGITGWAQVNGRKHLTPEEKEKLDGWYVRNASVWIDARIVFKTVQIVLEGARQSGQSREVSAVDGKVRDNRLEDRWNHFGVVSPTEHENISGLD
jgi:lipopolysaccharide/colanic/teichoic acid biosynthesis glycosyltransferase